MTDVTNPSHQLCLLVRMAGSRLGTVSYFAWHLLGSHQDGLQSKTEIYLSFWSETVRPPSHPPVPVDHFLHTEQRVWAVGWECVDWRVSQSVLEERREMERLPPPVRSLLHIRNHMSAHVYISFEKFFILY